MMVNEAAAIDVRESLQQLSYHCGDPYNENNGWPVFFVLVNKNGTCVKYLIRFPLCGIHIAWRESPEVSKIVSVEYADPGYINTIISVFEA